jgi:hypothetical protein
MIGFIISVSTEPRKQKNRSKPMLKELGPTFEIGMLAPEENQPLILEDVE